MSFFAQGARRSGWIRILAVVAGGTATVALASTISTAAAPAPETVYSPKSGYVRVVTPTSPQRPDDAPINLGSVGGGNNFWPDATLELPSDWFLADHRSETGDWYNVQVRPTIEVVLPDGRRTTVTPQLSEIEVGGQKFLNEPYNMYWIQDAIPGGGPGDPQPVEAMIPADTPIRLEIWCEAYGKQLHVVKELTDWQYTER